MVSLFTRTVAKTMATEVNKRKFERPRFPHCDKMLASQHEPSNSTSARGDPN